MRWWSAARQLGCAKAKAMALQSELAIWTGSYHWKNTATSKVGFWEQMRVRRPSEFERILPSSVWSWSIQLDLSQDCEHLSRWIRCKFYYGKWWIPCLFSGVQVETNHPDEHVRQPRTLEVDHGRPPRGPEKTRRKGYVLGVQNGREPDLHVFLSVLFIWRNWWDISRLQ